MEGNPLVKEGERFNDGKVDPAGRYWAGTLARDARGDIVEKAATLYRRDTDGKVKLGAENRLGWC